MKLDRIDLTENMEYGRLNLPSLKISLDRIFDNRKRPWDINYAFEKKIIKNDIVGTNGVPLVLVGDAYERSLFKCVDGNHCDCCGVELKDYMHPWREHASGLCPQCEAELLLKTNIDIKHPWSISSGVSENPWWKDI